MDAVNGEPFAGHRLELISSGGDIQWPEGVNTGNATKDTSSNEDVVFTVGGGA